MVNWFKLTVSNSVSNSANGMNNDVRLCVRSKAKQDLHASSVKARVGFVYIDLCAV